MSAITRSAASWPTSRSLYRKRARDIEKNCTPTMATPSATTEGCWAAREISHADVASSAIADPAAPAPSKVAKTSCLRAGRAKRSTRPSAAARAVSCRRPSVCPVPVRPSSVRLSSVEPSWPRAPSLCPCATSVTRPPRPGIGPPPDRQEQATPGGAQPLPPCARGPVGRRRRARQPRSCRQGWRWARRGARGAGRGGRRAPKPPAAVLQLRIPDPRSPRRVPTP